METPRGPVNIPKDVVLVMVGVTETLGVSLAVTVRVGVLVDVGADVSVEVKVAVDVFVAVDVGTGEEPEEDTVIVLWVLGTPAPYPELQPTAHAFSSITML